MNTQPITNVHKSSVNHPRSVRIMAVVDGIFLGVLPLACAVMIFMGNLAGPSFLRSFGQIIFLMLWYGPLEFYVAAGRLTPAPIPYIGYALLSLVPGLAVLITAARVWFGGTTSRTVLVVLVVVVNLLEAAAVLTVRSFGPFPSIEIISRWVLSGLLIGLNVWYFLRAAPRASS